MKRKISAARRAQLIKQLEKARAARGAAHGNKKAKKARKKNPVRDPYKGPKYKGTGVFLSEAERKAARARVLKKRKKAARKVNPIRHTPLYIIVAQKGNGPKMHYNGVKFTNNGKPVFFESVEQLKERARELVKKFPILRDYKLVGKPIRATVSGKIAALRTNPSLRVALEQEAELLEEFSGHKPSEVLRVSERQGNTGLVVGPLDFVGYTTVRDGVTEKYIHKFKRNSKPVLAVTAKGKQLKIVGGAYQFTEAGIEDR